MDTLTLADEFGKFIDEKYKDDYKKILSRPYYNFIDKEVEAMTFLTDMFIEFCGERGLVSISREMLIVFATFQMSTYLQLTR